jgi:LysM repeat protein
MHRFFICLTSLLLIYGCTKIVKKIDYTVSSTTIINNSVQNTPDQITSPSTTKEAIIVPKGEPVPDKVSVKKRVVSKRKNMIQYNTYTVKRGDCLWSIAKKKEVYNNPFMWPALWTTNRTHVTNPNKIEVNQKLRIQKTVAEEQKIKVLKKAYKYGEKKHGKVVR